MAGAVRNRRALWGLLLALLLAAWIQGDSLGAGLVSEDAAVLGYAHREPLFSDWGSAQYDLRTVRFWRPLTTATIDLQEGWTGVNPVCLRAFNWACQGLSIAAAVALLMALGTHWLGVLLGALWCASFPFQGGTVTWIVGRVDSQCLPLLLWAGWAGARGRPVALALTAGLAFATKESGVLAPLAGLALALAAGRGLGPSLRIAAPASLLILGLFLWRALAIGAWVGGYPALNPVGPLGWLASLPSFAEANPTGSLALALGLGLPLLARSGWRKTLPSCLALGLLALLLPMLAGSPLSPEHRRWWALPDAFAGLGMAVALVPLVRSQGRPLRLLVAGLLVGAIAWRAHGARLDVERWAQAGREAERLVSIDREQANSLAASPLPLLARSVPHTTADGGAYLLHFGLPDRFRAPFEATPRPVWPWRPLFGDSPEWLREPLGPAAGPLFRTPGESPDGLPGLAVEARVESQVVDGFLVHAAVAEPQPPGQGLELWLPLPPPGALGLELLIATELGYESARVAWPAVSNPAEERCPLPLRDALAAAGRYRLVDALAQAADFGSKQAWLELRALGADAEPLAVSAWIQLRFDPGLRDALLPK